eukprot:gene40395-63818_t
MAAPPAANSFSLLSQAIGGTVGGAVCSTPAGTPPHHAKYAASRRWCRGESAGEV